MEITFLLILGLVQVNYPIPPPPCNLSYPKYLSPFLILETVTRHGLVVSKHYPQVVVTVGLAVSSIQITTVGR